LLYKVPDSPKQKQNKKTQSFFIMSSPIQLSEYMKQQLQIHNLKISGNDVVHTKNKEVYSTLQAFLYQITTKEPNCNQWSVRIRSDNNAI
jgi:hypothetical protein